MADLKFKFAKAIVDNCIQVSTYNYCTHCLSGNHDKNDCIIHENDCIVLEAKEFLNTSNSYSYDPEFGDDKICECGHSYYRHFDSWMDMEPIGCKYCECIEFKGVE